ncbi:hypothetical protein, partial [Anaerorhabdus sp.]|uniref:hypothetical protein n=1 Tax=Anaerorhabdus sp. TaxID=1872524 RepID=UPI003053A395
YPDFQRLVLLSDYFGLTLDELVRDIDIQDVREKNMSSEKIDSIYNDSNSFKSYIKIYVYIGMAIFVFLAIMVAYGLIKG